MEPGKQHDGVPGIPGGLARGKQYRHENPAQDFATGFGFGVTRFIAANGDSIYSQNAGQGSNTADPEVKSVVGTETITGGTGRYADGKGSLTVNRLVNIVTGASRGSYNGYIIVRGGTH